MEEQAEKSRLDMGRGSMLFTLNVLEQQSQLYDHALKNMKLSADDLAILFTTHQSSSFVLRKIEENFNIYVSGRGGHGDKLGSVVKYDPLVHKSSSVEVGHKGEVVLSGTFDGETGEPIATAVVESIDRVANRGDIMDGKVEYFIKDMKEKSNS